MTDTPFFSVIVPTYNRAAHIGHAIRSLQHQRFSDFEIIIVDDGSNDDTAHVVMELAAKDTRVKYFPKQNEERSIARNYGIGKSKGKYVGFLDSDDYVLEDHLDKAHALLLGNGMPEVGHMGYKFVTESGTDAIIRNTFDSRSRSELIHENILHGNAIFVRRDVIDEINFIPNRQAILSEDWYVWLRLAARYPILFDNSITAVVRQHANRSLRNIDPEKLIASTILIIEYLKKDSVFMEYFRHDVNLHFAQHYSFLTLTLSLAPGYKTQTLRYLFKALSFSGKIVLTRRFWASVKLFLIRW